MLAAQGESGFSFLMPGVNPNNAEGTIFEKALHRLALVGNTDLLSKDLRKAASHCGGVQPAPNLASFKDTPYLADAGNACYAKVVRKLLGAQATREAMREEAQHIDKISKLNDNHMGDLIEASLAAANYAFCIERGEAHEWGSLCGGSYATGDYVTMWLVRAVNWEYNL